MQWQALLSNAANYFVVAKPFLAAVVLLVSLVLVGDKGSKVSLNRNSPCLAALCIFAFAIGTGLTTWFFLLAPLLALTGINFTLTYPMITMYGAFWLLIGVLISAKKLIYDAHRRQHQG